VPATLPVDELAAELAAAFDAWAAPSGLTFERLKGGAEAEEAAHIAIDFDDRTPVNEFVFDGPGGALAEVSANAITFDASERWELSSAGGKAHPHAARLPWDAVFKVLPIAMHEIGHCLGLSHSTDPRDVMPPRQTWDHHGCARR